MTKHTEENQKYIERALRGVHAEGTCRGDVCVIHKPSGHHMHEWPLNYRFDRGLMERVCVHGVGHPDPDGVRNWADGVHGCCGCCKPPLNEEK